MIHLYKEGEDIAIPLQVGDIIEVESGLFIKIKEILKETEEDFADIKKINVRIKGEVISNATRKESKRVRSRNS